MKNIKILITGFAFLASTLAFASYTSTFIKTPVVKCSGLTTKNINFLERVQASFRLNKVPFLKSSTQPIAETLAEGLCESPGKGPVVLSINQLI